MKNQSFLIQNAVVAVATANLLGLGGNILTNTNGTSTNEICDRCLHDMEEIQPCHLRCPNCGSHLDCTDKGSAW